MHIKTKSIALVTWMGTGNYGTSLQAFALNEYLKLQGYSVTFIPYWPQTKGLLSLFKNAADCIGLRFVYDKWRHRHDSLRQRRIFNFNKISFNQRKLYTRRQRKQLLNDIDVFISGSDQIWNTFYRFDPTMFLDFVKGKRKIAYAPSLGTDAIRDEYKETVKTFLMDFHKIGVRERTASLTLSKLTQRNDIENVIDPTFLLTASQWREFSNNADIDIILPQQFILCYAIGKNPEYSQQIKNIADVCCIKDIVIIPSQENPLFKIEGSIVYNDAGPLEFVQLISKAALVCTDSFHATALCINMGKNFVEFLRDYDNATPTQNSRIYDLLTLYNLHDRIYDGKNDKWADCIEYSTIHAILESERIRCTNFLQMAIDD